ncbi:MAG: hypothetical protein JNL70_01480 [Saprospiraceae bacterium]|nr:hypothetical protein [Saprospiraceae bacterium]
MKNKTFMIGLFLYLSVLLPLSMRGQNFARIDSIAMHAPPMATRSLSDLAAYCQANAHSDLEIVRFYFVWVARNIRYDERAAMMTTINFDARRQSPQFVFRSQKAICTGYSRLMEHLCKLSNIPILYVAGYGRGETYADSIETHAWNVVRVNGEWGLIDATWASNTLAKDSSELNIEFERYFMGISYEFQKGHLPYDPVFQLTKDLIKRYEFFKNKVQYTEGVESKTPDEDFTTILNRDYRLDSMSFTIQSHRRGLSFMPEDTNIVIKLRGALKEKQHGILTNAHEVLLDYSNSAEKQLTTLSIYTLRDWSNRFGELSELLKSALDINAEIISLETVDEKIAEAKLTQKQIFDLIGYFSQSWNQVKDAISKRN